jgi:DNA-binding IclR family transcriptional regulator
MTAQKAGREEIAVESMARPNAQSNGDGTGEREAPESLSPAVTRAAAILDLLALTPSTPLGTSELARRLGLPKSSIANICGALLEAGFLRRAGIGFSLGRHLAELGGAYLSAVDPVQEFYLACDELAEMSSETVQMGVLDGVEVTYIARHDGRQPIRLASEIGRRLPASCTAMGKAALASLPPDQLARRYSGIRWLPAMTAQSHRTVEALLTDLDAVRERGYAIDDEETAEGVVCYGVSFPGRRSGEGPYAISVTLLKVTALERRDAVVADLKRLASMLSDPLRRPVLTRSS